MENFPSSVLANTSPAVVGTGRANFPPKLTLPPRRYPTLRPSVSPPFRMVRVDGNLVAAPAKVDAVLGKTITLGCHIQMMPNLTLIQTSWERQLPSGREVLAVYHVRHGTHISPEFAHRVSFVSTTDRDVSISMKGVDLADKGSYTCKVSTFPLGNDQASTDVYVSAGPAALLEGEGESLVATCIAERGLPAATVSWETELSGRVETQRREEADGTASVSVRYLWKPRGDAQGKNLTCVVRHPTLETDFRKDHTLNVHFAPTVLIKGEKKNWYAGQADVTLICDAQANPPVREYTWARWVDLFTTSSVLGGVKAPPVNKARRVPCHLTPRRRTFRGDYYTKQYLGPSDMQKETQMDVLQPHELQEVYGEKSHNGSQELKSKLSADLIYGGEERGGGGDDWAERECDYFADGYRGQKPQHPCGPPVLANGSPYLPDDCRNNCADGDYVAHVDGSVISRREWYV
uniref:Nectin cell adhesion molecule 3 n=1 Tax=Hippocampus comes TaxID=109280 RepID=A0A3Q2YBF3_HIPCM